MANIFTPSIEGDGINFTFFQKLWHTNRNEEKEHFSSSHRDNRPKRSQTNPIRLPDTVIFQLGQPLHWYFTSERGRQTIILRKRKQNVNIEKIEEEFLRKFKVKNGGFLHQDDVIAYFIASSDCTFRNRRSIKQSEIISGNENEVGNDMISRSNLKHEDQNQSGDNVCDIEYFNEEGLREYVN